MTVEDETDTAKQINARQVSEFVNEKLLPVFAEFDVDLVVAVKDDASAKDYEQIKQKAYLVIEDFDEFNLEIKK